MNNDVNNTGTPAENRAPQNTGLVRVMSAISIICSLGVVVLAMLQLFNVMQNAVFFYMPLMGVVMLTQAVRLWSTKSHGVAVFSLIVAIFLFAVTVITVIIR